MTEYLFARLDDVEDLDDDLQAQIDAINVILSGLSDIVSLTPDDGAFIVGNGTVFVTETGNTARTSLGLGTGDSPTLTALTLSGTGLNLASTGAVDWASRGAIKAAADGILTLLNDAEDGFTRLQLGGTTSSFPGIQRSGAALAAVLADGSDVTGFNAATVIVSGSGEAEAALSRGSGLTLGSTLPVCWSDTTAYNGTPDLFLYRDAANVLGLRNGLNTQELRVYNTYTSGSNYETGYLKWDATYFRLGTAAAGAGSPRSIIIEPSASGGALFFNLNGATAWMLTAAAGHLLAGVDNTLDIGENGANRPRNGYFANTVSAADFTLLGGGAFQGQANSLFYWAGRAVLASPADGIIRLSNNVQNDFDRLQFGGTTSSFPSLKRSTTAIHIRLADDSDFAPLFASALTLSAGMTVEGAVVFNEAGADVDFRIEGDTATHLFFLDASADRIGVNTATPDEMFHVVGGNIKLSDGQGLFFAGDDVAPTAYIYGSTSSDYLRFRSTSTDRMEIGASGIVVNEGGGDFDVRMEGDTEPNLFLLDAGADAIVLGHSAALGAAFASFTNTARFQVHGTSNPTSSASFSRWSADTGAAVLYLQKSRNATRGSHTVVQDADLLGVLSAGGSDGTDMAEGARITFEVDGTPGNNVMPGRILFSTSGAASEVPTERFRFGSAMAVFNEVGGDYDLRMEGDNEVNLFYLDAGNDRIGFGTASPAARVHIVDTLRFASTAATIDSDHSFYFGTYECLASAFFTLTQSEDQSDFDGGGFRDVIAVFHYDDDTTNYEALSDQKVSYGIRSYVTPSTAGGLSNAQYKDFTAGTFECIGRIEWADRGCSGITASAIQYGQGIASNELFAGNPAAASTQSLSMAAVQGIISGKKGASDASHRVRAFLATNLGKQATAAFQALSAGTDGDNGQFEYLLSGDGATVATAAIIMPASGTGQVGTRILYDTGDYTDFDRSGNLFSWVIGGSGELFLSIGTLAPVVDGGLQLGTASTQWADLFLESGALINFANGNFTLTHSSGLLTASGAVSVALGLRVGFTGAPTDDAVTIGDANFQLLFSATVPLIAFDSNDYIVFNRSSNFYDMVIGGTTKLRVDSTATAGDTALMIWDVDNATLERVTVGAAGSGGTGKKLLCINN